MRFGIDSIFVQVIQQGITVSRIPGLDLVKVIYVAITRAGIGQIKEVAVSGGSKEQTFEMRAFEYATNHYFVDLAYKGYYEDYYRNEPPVITQEMQANQIVEEEVWVQRQGGIPDPFERQGVAILDLPALPQGTPYSQSVRDRADVPGSVESAPFVKLDRTQYELDGDGYLGVLSLNVNVGDQQVVGIAYRTADTRQFGELARDTTAGQRIILKMVKPRNLILQPLRHFWWRYITLQGYRDGLHGLRLCTLLAYYYGLLTYLQLYKIQRLCAS